MKERPVKETPVKESPVKESPVKETPVKESIVTTDLRFTKLTKFRTRLAVVALAIGSAFATVPVAEAQFGGRSGMATMFTPDFLSRDMPVFVDSLALEEWQRPVLEVLLQDYETNFNTAADGVRAKMASFKDVAAGASADRVIEMISEPLVAWTAEKKKLRESFLAGVKGILGDSQTEYWPRLERALRREKSLPMGELSGESIDLTLIVREVQASPLALDAARAAIEEYEIKLDGALSVRDEALDSAIAPLLKAMSSSDDRSGVAAQEAIMQKRIAVRAAQEAGITAIRDALGAEYGSAFERRALEKSFPMVFRPDPITPLFDAAFALTDLSEDQKGQLTALKAQFETEHPTVLTGLVEAYKLTEPGEPRRRTELARQRAQGASVRFSEAPELEAAKKAREDLYERYRNQIVGVLNTQQREALPGFSKEVPLDPEKDKAMLERRDPREGAPSGGGADGGSLQQHPTNSPLDTQPKPTKKPAEPPTAGDSGFGPTNTPPIKKGGK